MNVYSVEVTSKKQLTNKLYELNIRLIDPATISFKAGQCVGFHTELTKNPKMKRLYSIASLPEHGGELSFVIDVSPGGIGSQFVLNLKPGDKFTMEGPYGGFTVNDNLSDILMIATGAGIAPFKAMILDLLHKDYPKEITLLFGVRSEQDKVYFDLFEQLSHEHPQFIFIPTLSQPSDSWNGSKGRVTAFLDQNYQSYKNNRIYICGSPVMVKDVRANLITKGKDQKEIKLELFV